jgi:hypothetical protein
MRHLQASTLVTALHIKSLVCFGAIQDSLTLSILSHILREQKPHLVAPNRLRNRIQRVNDPQPKLLPTLVFGDRNILDMADEA